MRPHVKWRGSLISTVSISADSPIQCDFFCWHLPNCFAKIINKTIQTITNVDRMLSMIHYRHTYILNFYSLKIDTFNFEILLRSQIPFLFSKQKLGIFEMMDKSGSLIFLTNPFTICTFDFKSVSLCDFTRHVEFVFTLKTKNTEVVNTSFLF